MLVPESMGRLQSVMPHAVLLYIGVCVCVGEKESVCICIWVCCFMSRVLFVETSLFSFKGPSIPPHAMLGHGQLMVSVGFFH